MFKGLKNKNHQCSTNSLKCFGLILWTLASRFFFFYLKRTIIFKLTEIRFPIMAIYLLTNGDQLKTLLLLICLPISNMHFDSILRKLVIFQKS